MSWDWHATFIREYLGWMVLGLNISIMLACWRLNIIVARTTATAIAVGMLLERRRIAMKFHQAGRTGAPVGIRTSAAGDFDIEVGE